MLPGPIKSKMDTAEVVDRSLEAIRERALRMVIPVAVEEAP